MHCVLGGAHWHGRLGTSVMSRQKGNVVYGQICTPQKQYSFFYSQLAYLYVKRIGFAEGLTFSFIHEPFHYFS